MTFREAIELVVDSGRDFLEDDCQSQAAALSYYTIFSLPALLAVLLLILGSVMGPHQVQGQLELQITALMGPAAADQIRTILREVHRPGEGGPLATVLSVGALLLGASGAFGQLQAALNRAWEVAPDPNQGGIRRFLFKRVFSFGMVLAVAFFLLVSLSVSAALGAFGGALSAMLPAGISTTLLEAINQAISLLVISALFAAMFKVLPDARVAWRDVWVGALVTAVLFEAGKFVIGFYLGRSNPGQAFGAAASLAVLFVWVYYSAMILLFGAEFTKSWADRRGSGIAPQRGAVRVVAEKRTIRERVAPA
jgi:membrane protein